MKPSTVVLLVEADDVAADQISTWINDAGGWVLRCRGPHEPTYVCRGWTDQRCLLADAAEVVIVDMRLDTDAALQGPPAWELVNLYRAHDRPVVVLAEPALPAIIAEPGVSVLPHRPEREALLASITSALNGRSGKSARVPAASVADIWL